jgi:hypothetical protein
VKKATLLTPTASEVMATAGTFIGSNLDLEFTLVLASGAIASSFRGSDANGSEHHFAVIQPMSEE